MDESSGEVLKSKIHVDATESVRADHDFVRLLKQKDPTALDQLWENLYRDSVYIARRYDQPEDMGYEAAITTYEKILKTGIYNFKFNASFRRYCWVFLSRDLFRLIRKQLPISDQEVPELADYTQNQYTADRETIWQRLRHCVEHLKGNRLRVFAAIDLEGRPPADVAFDLGLTRNNVNQLAMRARRDMRSCLEKLGYNSSLDVMSL